MSYYSRDDIQSHSTGSGYLRSKDGERERKKKRRAEESTPEAASQSKKRELGRYEEHQETVA